MANLSDYIVNFTSLDTLNSVTGRGATTTNDITIGNLTSTGIDDNAASTAITIDSDGDVGIGLASPLFQAANRTAVTINGTTSSNLVFGIGGSANTYLLADAAGFTIGNTSATLPTMFYTNGAERMRIDSSGNVGIGTTSPVDKLHVYSGASGGSAHSYSQLVVENSTHNAIQLLSPDSSEQALWFGDASSSTAGGVTYYHPDNIMTFRSNGSERMRIDSSGNVGIGTSSPGHSLDISTGATSRINTTDGTRGFISGVWASQPRIETSGGTLSVAAGGAYDIAFSTNGSERMRIDSSGNTVAKPSGGEVTLGANGHITSKQSLDVATAGGRYIGASNRGIVGQIRIEQTTTSADGGYVSFDTCASGSTSPTERMRIDSSGNVGIGTTSPALASGWSTALHVNGSGSGAHISLTDTTTGATNTDGLVVGQYQANSYFINRENGFQAFYTNNAERMRIDSSGNVLINTTSQYGSNRLNVNGGLAIDGRNAATPGLCEKGDTNTGIFWPTTDTLGVSTGGAERMRISDAGNVYIGTTNNWYTASGRKILRVHGAEGGSFLVLDTSGSGDFYIESGNNGQVNLWNQANADMVFGTNNTERMRILPSGNIGMGLSSDYYSAKLAVGQSGGNPAIACRTTNSTGTVALVLFTDGNSQDCGSIDVNTTANTTNYGTASDQRLKENIVDAPSGNIDDVRVRSFDWKSSGHHQTYGLVAQELVDVAPEAVSQGKKEEDTWKVDYSKLVPMMIKEIQDLKAEVAALKGE